VEAISPLLPLTNSVGSGDVSPFYNSGLVNTAELNSQDGVFQMQFSGVVDLPYAIWASPDLLDWSEIGIADQPLPGTFQFTDTTATNLSSRFYEVRLP
jgi:hypothetical protein